MSVSYTAYAIIGVRVPISKLVTPVRIRNFNCGHDLPKDIPEESQKYCRECGAVIWKTGKQIASFISSKKPQDCLYPQWSECTIGGFSIMGDTGYVLERDTSEKHAFVGLSVGTTYEQAEVVSRVSPEWLGSVKDRLKAVLEGVGLWDEKEFGLWAVSRCS